MQTYTQTLKTAVALAAASVLLPVASGLAASPTGNLVTGFMTQLSSLYQERQQQHAWHMSKHLTCKSRCRQSKQLKYGREL